MIRLALLLSILSLPVSAYAADEFGSRFSTRTPSALQDERGFDMSPQGLQNLEPAAGNSLENDPAETFENAVKPNPLKPDASPRTPRSQLENAIHPDSRH